MILQLSKELLRSNLYQRSNNYQQLKENDFPDKIVQIQRFLVLETHHLLKYAEQEGKDTLELPLSLLEGDPSAERLLAVQTYCPLKANAVLS